MAIDFNISSEKAKLTSQIYLLQDMMKNAKGHWPYVYYGDQVKEAFEGMFNTSMIVSTDQHTFTYHKSTQTYSLTP